MAAERPCKLARVVMETAEAWLSSYNSVVNSYRLATNYVLGNSYFSPRSCIRTPGVSSLRIEGLRHRLAVKGLWVRGSSAASTVCSKPSFGDRSTAKITRVVRG